MEAIRKIVQIDEVGPRRSKKSRRTALIGGILGLVVGGAGIAVFLLAGTKEVPTISEFELATVSQGPLTQTSSASGTVVLSQTISVAAPQTGYANQLFVKEGDTVQENTLLATLSVPDLEDEKLDLEAELAVAKITYEGLVNDWSYTIQTTKTSLSRAEDTIVKDQKDADVKKELSTLKSSLLTDYQTALDLLVTDRQKRDDLVAQLENQVKKRELELAKQNASIAQIETSLRRIRGEIEGARIKSPIAGEVLSVDASLAVPKSLITQYTVLIKVADPTSTFIDLEVNESDSGSLKIGDRLTLTVSTKTLVATITSIGKVASLSSDGLTATVTVRVKPVEPVTLTSGASAAATITLGTKNDALTLPRGAYLTTGAQKWVYVVKAGVAKKIAVTFGTLQANTVEVKSGLKAADTVIVSGYQDFIDQPLVQLDKTRLNAIPHNQGVSP